MVFTGEGMQDGIIVSVVLRRFQNRECFTAVNIVVFLLVVEQILSQVEYIHILEIFRVRVRGLINEVMVHVYCHLVILSSQWNSRKIIIFIGISYVPFL